MASKRKLELDEDDDDLQQLHVSNKKHTLDSDEEDSDDYERDDLNDSDIEGEEEESATNVQDGVKITPFNMREELQEGHFDKDGQYHWNKDDEIKDNWLDNIDWVKVKTDKNYLSQDENSKDAGSAVPDVYNELQAYAQVLKFMQPDETVQRTLQRLGKNRAKISTAERLRRKKMGIVDEAGEQITKFSELTNEILTRSGNMDIYQETYQQIKAKLNTCPSTSKGAVSADVFDMYADDFAEKEKKHLETTANKETDEQKETGFPKELQWEFKWQQADSDDQIQGPYQTTQMLKWANEKYFKEGVYVRKVGESTNFYSSNRIDFDLYL